MMNPMMDPGYPLMPPEMINLNANNSSNSNMNNMNYNPKAK